MHRRGQSPNSFFRTISFAAIASLMIVAIAIPAFTQNSVPPTAVQAAKMPQLASRLAHPARRVVPPPKSQVFARATKHTRPLDSSDIYDNGPINGNTDAWTINFGFIVADTFTITSDQGSITGMSFGAWLSPGDTVTSVEVSITSGAFGGTSYFDQTVNLTQSNNCSTNQYGYNICTVTGSFNAPALNAGTYWVNLQNASAPSGDPVYWDENSGVGCQGQGCPSLAAENSVGSIPSEAFTILGSATTTSTSNYDNYACPGPQPGFHDLHEFSANTEASGLAIDTAGKLYGTFPKGGKYGAGLLYDLAEKAGGWFSSTLYNFLGGSDGSEPNGVIVGPGGVLYGAASGGSYGLGLIYKATPPPNGCPTAICYWNVTPIYEFVGNGEAVEGVVTTFDSAGNLYGVGGGGAYVGGSVFELSPAGSGWTEKVLYSFTGGADGAGPNSLVFGHDGNLYGTTYGGGTSGQGTECYGSCGVVFQLVPSGSGWTEIVLHSFTGLSDGYEPGGMVQDGQGNLYGYSTCYTPFANYCNEAGTLTQLGLIFQVVPSVGAYVIYNAEEDCEVGSNLVHGLAVDAAGELYAAEGGYTPPNCGPWGCYSFYCGEIVGIVPNHQPLVTGTADIFWNVASDANGNLYGTASSCGFGTPQRNAGMIWQYSP